CRWLTLFALLAAGHSQVAAQSLRFASDVDAAIKTARREDRPLMFYLVDRSRRGNEDLRRRQSRVFRDLRVRRAAAPFVGVELAIDQHPELSRRWQLAPRTDGLVLFADATGEKLHATQTGDANAFLRELNRARRAFAANAWEQRLAARLRDPATPAPELCAALRRVGELEIRDAD